MYMIAYIRIHLYTCTYTLYFIQLGRMFSPAPSCVVWFLCLPKTTGNWYIYGHILFMFNTAVWVLVLLLTSAPFICAWIFNPPLQFSMLYIQVSLAIYKRGYHVYNYNTMICCARLSLDTLQKLMQTNVW